LSASPELLQHLALRRAISEQATSMMDEAEFAAGWNSDLGQQTVSKSEPDDAEALAAAVALIAKAANPTLSGSPAESKPAWLVKSMSNTKEAIWTQIQDAAAKDPATSGLGKTVEQAISAFLGTPAGSKLYEAWTKAPWDASAGSQFDVQKSENPGAPRGSSKVTRSAADEATLIQMGIEAEASLKR
jgi:cytochrome c556